MELPNRSSFAHLVLSLFPSQWVKDFGAYEALDVLDIDDIFSMAYIHIKKEQLDKIIKLCIETVSLEFSRVRDGSHYDLLKAIKREKKIHDMIARGIKHDRKIIQSRVQLILEKGKFNGEMYYLTRSDKCKDPEFILSLFCNEPVRKIQRLWRKYIRNKRDKSARVIQNKALEWLYRPGGPIAKKAGIHFNSLF